MEFEKNLIPGRLVRRYKRFLADVELPSGEVITAHCPNSGSMLGVKEPGSRVYVMPYDPASGRKLLYTLELVEADGTWVGINTSRTNHLVAEGLERKLFKEFQEYATRRREVTYAGNSRVDFLLEKEGLSPLYLEVKNVTLRRDGMAQFPDAVTERGAKHLDALSRMAEEGARSAILYVVQREDCEAFSLAKDIDFTYSDMAKSAKKKGVEAYCYTCHVSPTAITISKNLKIIE